MSCLDLAYGDVTEIWRDSVNEKH